MRKLCGLVALMLCIGAAGCFGHKSLGERLMKWSDDFSGQASNVVEDPVRAAQVGRISRELSAEIALFYGEIGLIQTKIVRLNADYDAKRDEFEALFEESRRNRKARSEYSIQLAMEMRAQMTPEEWDRLVEKADPPTVQ